MNQARELAFELSQLPAAQRVQLLSELPGDRRAVIEPLIAQVGRLLDAQPEGFERHLQRAAAAPPLQPLQPLARLSERRLRLLLRAEHACVQRRVIAAVRGTRGEALPPAVAAVVAEYLENSMQAADVHGGRSAGARRRWWHRWRGARP